MEKVKQSPKRIFINNVDSYASTYIAKFLSEYGVGVFPDLDGENGEEAEVDRRMISSHDEARAFKVVGTVSEKTDKDRPYVLEEYLQLDRDELLPKLMACDVVIYNITQHIDQVGEALWAVSALHSEMENFSRPKIFILVSTVMTWACSKPMDPDDPELPFTDEIFRRRRAHPNFQQHIDVEKRVVKMGKTNRMRFSTYVVASGLQYGMGEQIFHYFFKTSWLGQEQQLPVFGDGNNIVPTIHIHDLASVIQNVIEHQPEIYYLLAVDHSNNTIESIVKTVASALGPGKIQKRPFEEAFLTRDLSLPDVEISRFVFVQHLCQCCNVVYAVLWWQKDTPKVMEIDSILINLRMKGVYIKELFSVNWLCESGLVDNIELVVEEYRQTRGLLPIRLCVLGPPAVGKSMVSNEICKHYKLHHIRLKDTISEAIEQLEGVLKNADPEAEIEDSAAEAQELLSNIKGNMEQNGGLLDDQLLVKVVKDKLMSNPCRNQGFVLDGFPKTYNQARELFSSEGDESDDGTFHISSVNKNIIPEFVLCLDASDALLKDRVMNLPERLVQEHNYEHEHFLWRLARYRENNVEDETVVNYFDELNIALLSLEITSSDEPNCLLLMQKVFDTVGKHRNYGPSIWEVKEDDRREAQEKMWREAQERAEEERWEAEETRLRATRWEEWSKALEETRQQEEELLTAQSEPMRSYLMEHVLPTLSQGLIECCTVQPQDPVDFLAEYLFKNNPVDY